MWTLEACCLVVERSSLGCINPEWNAIKRSYFHWTLNFESVKSLIENYLLIHARGAHHSKNSVRDFCDFKIPRFFLEIFGIFERLLWIF